MASGGGSDLGATFVPGGWDDYYMPEVVAPAPQRVTPQVPQNMQEDLQRMELEARDASRDAHPGSESSSRHTRDPSLSTWMRPSNQTDQAKAPPPIDTSFRDYPQSDSAVMSAGPSFSHFPKVKGDNIPPSDEEKEEILWKARDHVLGSQIVSMQIAWARDVLAWAEIAMETGARQNPDNPRPATPKREHQLREDATNIITYLAGQDHPEALYIRSKWLEFGKFGHRLDKREAYSGYKKASELGQRRAEYRIGMLFEQSNDISKAKEHYYKGLSMQDSAARYRLGMMSLLGQLGEAKDYQTGLERIRAAADGADEDSPQGAFVYGMLISRELPDIYIPDSLLPNNLESAKMYVEKAAYLGFAKAQHKMGQAYELCQLGCEFNPSYSLHYYGLAANQGNAEAALGVSRWFLFGYEGVFKKNEELAYKYAQQAAAQKLPTGMFAMGYYNEIGIHVPKALMEARRWYQKAADNGNKDAIGRLESLNQDKTLSKQDHETTTLTRIKSQHGSQRGKRPERFKQQGSQMPTLNESTSPHPSAGPEPVQFPDPSRPTPVSSNQAPPFHIRQDPPHPPSKQLPPAPAPYPEDDRPPYPAGAGRSKSAAPYPEDDVRGPGHGRAAARPPPHGWAPQADRPGSAFGVKGPAPAGRPIPASQSMGNLHPSSQHPDPRGRVTSAGGPGPGNFRQPSPGPGPPPPHGHLPGRDPGHGRPASAAPYPPGGGGRTPGPPGGLPPAGTHPGGRGGPEQRLPSQGGHYQSGDRYTPGPPDAGRPDRLNAMPQAQQQQRHSHAQPDGRRPVHGAAGPGRTGSAPPAQMQKPEQKPTPTPSPVPSAATMPAKPSKGPATFEDMGIPQGKQDGDCVVM